jgi:Flp pilus assembly protein CpaB
MRAMRVVVTDALVPRAGAAVDVLATYDPSSAGSEGATIVVAAGVTVLGTDDRGGAATGGTGSAGVTLLVDPDQASALADAQANGVITLTLVPPEDTAGS